MRWVPLFLLALALPAAASREQTAWVEPLERKVAEIDRATPGELGVLVRRVGEGPSLRYGADRRWYLASTTKVVVAIVAMQMAERGELDLGHRVTLTKSD